MTLESFLIVCCFIAALFWLAVVVVRIIGGA